MIKILTLVLILLLDVNTYAQQTAAAKLADMTSGYDIQDSVLITTRDGAIISAMVARKKGDVTPKPVILQYTIYVRDNGRDLRTIKESVDNGYVGVIAYSRGKRFSPDEIFPYENEANDTYDVIDWISRQEWCNGSVGMAVTTGSHNGLPAKHFTLLLKQLFLMLLHDPGMGCRWKTIFLLTPIMNGRFTLEIISI